MDQTANPCVDFYQYACGGWMQENPVPDWTATWDRLTVLREAIQREMRQMLESDNDFHKDNTTLPIGIRKARSFYRSCMDTGKFLKNMH